MAAAEVQPTVDSERQPKETLYCHNLNEKLKKEDLKKCLYAIFSQFGRILDIVSLKTYRLRGQAWITFADTNAATIALNSMNGFPFFDKPMKLEFAKTPGDAILKLRGEFDEKKKKERSKQSAVARAEHLKRSTGRPSAAGGGGGTQAGAGGREETQPPNKILFLQNLPEQTNESMLEMLFNQYAGFKEVRMVTAKPGIAFVEYDSDMQASVAMSGLQDFQVTANNKMRVTYAKQ
ncbi:hypothetical protein WJX74_006742 [Apatococcus lobatus]|uniref:RRM domain-containing protein n=1 Tax=Apatococcus lobatus TaxID=904363 RepID=A0AAW1RD14_9CHLO